MAPIRKGDGTAISPQGFQEVRKGDGTILWSAGDEIPDSAINQWKFDEGSGEDVFDSIGDEDGTVNGLSWVSGDYEGGYALEATSSSGQYLETTVWPDFENWVMSNFSFSITVNYTINGAGDYFVGTYDDDWPTNLWGMHIGSGDGDGELGARIHDSSGNQLRINTTESFNDGNNHRFTWVKAGTSESDWGLWVDGEKRNTSVESSSGTVDSGFNIGSPITFFRRSVYDSDSTVCTLDNPVRHNTALSDSEVVNDYENQPWS